TNEMPALESRRVRTQPLTVTGASWGAWPARISRTLNSRFSITREFSVHENGKATSPATVRLRSGAPGKHRPRQRTIVPGHPASGIADHVQPVQGRAGRRKGVIEKLAVAPGHFGPGIEEGARHHHDPRARPVHGRNPGGVAGGACARLGALSRRSARNIS